MSRTVGSLFFSLVLTLTFAVNVQAERDYPRPICSHKTKVLVLDGRGADLDKDGLVDLEYLSEDFMGNEGPFLGAEGGESCEGEVVGSGNRLCPIGYVNSQIGEQLFSTDFCVIEEAPGYVAGSDGVGAYFTYVSANDFSVGEVYILKSNNGLNYYKVQVAGFNGKTIKLYFSEIAPPAYENCYSFGQEGLDDYIDWLSNQ